MKVSLIILLLISLSGCASISGVLSGNSKQEFATNADGDLLTTRGLFGQRPVKVTTRRSQAAVNAEAQRDALIALANAEQAKALAAIAEAQAAPQQSGCATYTFEQVNALKADAQAAYENRVSQCEMMRLFATVVQGKDSTIKALTQGQSDIAVVTNTFSDATKALAAEGTKKFQSITQLGGIVAGAAGISSVVRSVTGSLASVGRSAAENAGNTTVGNISVSQDNIATISSNDAEANGGFSTGGGFGEGEEGLAGGGGTASSTPTITQSRDGDSPVDFIFGDGNTTSFTTVEDEGVALINPFNSQQLEESANGAVTNDSNIDQQPVIDEQNDEISNQPNNGSGNEVF